MKAIPEVSKGMGNKEVGQQWEEEPKRTWAVRLRTRGRGGNKTLNLETGDLSAAHHGQLAAARNNCFLWLSEVAAASSSCVPPIPIWGTGSGLLKLSLVAIESS